MRASMVTRSLVLLALAAAAPAAPALAARPSHPAFIGETSDFNGDTLADLAIGIPGESIGGRAGAGAVLILYGEAGKGPTTAHVQLLHQDGPSVPEQAEAGDAFGRSVAAGDFDDDGFDDLAVGIPGEDIAGPGGTIRDAGAVQTFVGSSSGLSAAGGELVKGFDVQAGARFGFAAEAVDMIDAFTGLEGRDGAIDIAVGMPGYNAGRGAVVILAGGYLSDAANGTESRTWDPDVPPGTQTGFALASADFDSDYAGGEDLAVGQPGFDIPASGSDPGITDAGRIAVLYDASGVTVDYISQASSRIADDAENGDRFGSVLAAGDLNQEGWNDLLVGVPNEDLGGRADAGMVITIISANDGSGLGPPVNEASVALTLGSAARAGDRLGAAVTAGDFGADNVWADDVAAGIPGREVGGIRDAGAVRVWETVGNTTGGGLVQTLTQQTPDVADAAERGDGFGSVLIKVPGPSSDREGLIVGVPGEDLGPAANAGLLTILRSKSGGLLTGAGSRTLSESSARVPDAPEDGDRFGGSMVLSGS